MLEFANVVCHKLRSDEALAIEAFWGTRSKPQSWWHQGSLRARSPIVFLAEFPTRPKYPLPDRQVVHNWQWRGQHVRSLGLADVIVATTTPGCAPVVLTNVDVVAYQTTCLHMRWELRAAMSTLLPADRQIDRAIRASGRRLASFSRRCVYRKRRPHCTGERIAAGWRR